MNDDTGGSAAMHRFLQTLIPDPTPLHLSWPLTQRLGGSFGGRPSAFRMLGDAPDGEPPKLMNPCMSPQ
jgi:hypothetical protein